MCTGAGDTYHGSLFYLLNPLATLVCIYSAVKAIRTRASWAALCALLIIGNLKIHSVQLPQLMGLSREAAEAAVGAPGPGGAVVHTRSHLDNAR